MTERGKASLLLPSYRAQTQTPGARRNRHIRPEWIVPPFRTYFDESPDKSHHSSTESNTAVSLLDPNDNPKEEDGNKELDMHYDSSEATLNVCLSCDNFTSGGLRFCGRFGDNDHRTASHMYNYSKGHTVLHLGRHRHGADNISDGERINLILRARNSAYRGAAAFDSPHRKELGDPELLCLSKANDRDYEAQLKRLDKGGGSINPAPNRNNNRVVNKRRRVVS